MPKKCHLSWLLQLETRDQTPPPSSPLSCSSILLCLLHSLFMPSHLTPSSLLKLFCLLWVMQANDLSCRLLRVYAFPSSVVPCQPSLKVVSEAVLFLLPSFVSPLGCRSLRFAREDWTSHVMVQIAVRLRYHVRSQEAQTLQLN